MGGVVTGFSVIGTVIALGYLLGRAGVLGPSAQEVLSRTAFFVATPALLFVTLARADIGAVFSGGLLTTVVSLALVAGLAAAAGLWWRRPLAEVTIGALCAGYVNAGNLGVPIAVFVLGDAAYVAPVLLLQMVVVVPVVFVVLDLATGKHAVSWWRLLLQPLRNPITVASMLGLVVATTGVPVPEPVVAPIELIGGLAVPAVLLAFGISLHGSPLPGAGEQRRQVWTVVALKVVVHPLLAYAVARFGLGMEGTPLLAAVLTSALPTAQNIFVYAVRYGVGVTLAREAILLSTAVSVPVIVVVTALLA